MNTVITHQRGLVGDQVPLELIELKERIAAQSAEIRAVLEPLVEDAMEHARFRGRAMGLARDAWSASGLTWRCSSSTSRLPGARGRL